MRLQEPLVRVSCAHSHGWPRWGSPSPSPMGPRFLPCPRPCPAWSPVPLPTVCSCLCAACPAPGQLCPAHPVPSSHPHPLIPALPGPSLPAHVCGLKAPSPCNTALSACSSGCHKYRNICSPCHLLQSNSFFIEMSLNCLRIY